VIACLCASTLLLLAASSWAQTFSGRVIAVHDGDTISVREATRTIRVRLADIDSPEFGQAHGASAREFTSQLLLDHVVQVQGRGLDQYDRVIGRVSLGRVNANEAIVRAGMAWVYSRGAADAALADAERSAKARHAGLWADASPTPPWVWRRAHQATAPDVPASRPRAEAQAAERIALPEARGPFHGNTQSRVFHRAGCPHYNCKQCDDEFLTAQSALEAGYRPAGDCLR
jgi:endonuclease YncB( thermonuclease family)